MKILIIGFGSIGRKHAAILQDAGVEIVVVSKQNELPYKTYADLNLGLLKENPDVVFICNKTSEHFTTLIQLTNLKYKGIVFIEKPIFDKSHAIESLPFLKCLIGYNLRFHPLIEKLKTDLQKEKILSVVSYVGQYLPNWRPDVDYRQSYSSHAIQGGGVLRDLSHEIDLVYWLFGEVVSVAAKGGKISNLEIDSEDSYSILLSTQHVSQISLTMNYLDRISQRTLIINCQDNSFLVDLVGSRYKTKETEEVFQIDKNSSYKKQIDLLLKKDYQNFCEFQDGLKVMKCIEMIEESNKNNVWIHL